MKIKQEPRCDFNRALKLTVTTVLLLLFLSLYYANVQLVKRDILVVTAVIYCYITTDFHYANRDSRLSAYGGVRLQMVCIEKNVIRYFSLKFSKFRNKKN